MASSVGFEAGGPEMLRAEEAGRRRRVFLVGLMGAGKTAVGEVIARALRLNFVDVDRELQRRTGKQIADIFREEGEFGFRTREAQLIEELTLTRNVVLATGGGAVLRPESRERLRSRGRVVYLHADAKALWQRTRGDNRRPLLQVEDPLGTLRTLCQTRDPLYRECAHTIIETTGLTELRVAEILLAQLKAMDEHLPGCHTR